MHLEHRLTGLLLRPECMSIAGGGWLPGWEKTFLIWRLREAYIWRTLLVQKYSAEKKKVLPYCQDQKKKIGWDSVSGELPPAQSPKKGPICLKLSLKGPWPSQGLTSDLRCQGLHPCISEEVRTNTNQQRVYLPLWSHQEPGSYFHCN